MNKYAVAGILADVIEGARVVVVERSNHEVREALGEFQRLAAALDIPSKVRAANGRESVELGTGWVRFATPRGDRLRGLSVDVVFIDNDADRVLHGDEMDAADLARLARFREDVALSLNARGGVVVYS